MNEPQVRSFERENGGITHLPASDAPAKRPGFIARMNERSGKNIEITQGTAWLLGIAFVVITFGLNIGGSLWSKSGEDATVKASQIALQKAFEEKLAEDRQARADDRREMKELKQKFDDMREERWKQALIDAEKRGQTQGFTLGREAEQP